MVVRSWRPEGRAMCAALLAQSDLAPVARHSRALTHHLERCPAADLVRIGGGGNNSSSSHTWGHPRVALLVAHWALPSLADCTRPR